MTHPVDETGMIILSDGAVVRNVHIRAECEGRETGCWVHAPSDHPLRDAPIVWHGRWPERICEHGGRHPDRDAVAYSIGQARRYGREVDVSAYGEHDCDGCC